MKYLLVGLLALGACRSTPPAATPDATPATPKIFTLGFQNMSLGDPDHEKDGQPDPIAPSVYVTITKNDPEAGKVTYSLIQFAKDRIGWKNGTSVHRVFSSKRGRATTVDFDTGYVLDRIEIVVVPYEYKVCERLGEGLPCKGPTTLRDIYSVWRVSFSSSGGQKERFEAPDGPRRRNDAICTAHGGTIKAPTLSPERVRELRTREASQLLMEAESGWASKNPKVRARSQADYRTLLKDFPEERCVVENKDRIKARAEAVLEE